MADGVNSLPEEEVMVSGAGEGLALIREGHHILWAWAEEDKARGGER